MRGKILYQDKNGNVIYGPNLEVVKQANDAYLEQAELEPDMREATGGRIRFVDGGPGIARRVAYLTQGQQWPAQRPPGRAVFTSRDARLRGLMPALAGFGLKLTEYL